MQKAHSDSAIRTPSAGFAAAQLTRPVSAPQSNSAPNSGGCISDISSDAIHGCDHDYTAAMKNYGVIYEQYQAYLLPDNQLQPHNYDLAAAQVPAFNHLGCLNEELLEATVHSDVISDDDIENCGYLGWLYH
jgi:hypothetical protein